MPARPADELLISRMGINPLEFFRFYQEKSVTVVIVQGKSPQQRVINNSKGQPDRERPVPGE